MAGSGTLSILYSGSAVSYNAYFGASGGSTTVSPTAVPDMTTVIQCWEPKATTCANISSGWSSWVI